MKKKLSFEEKNNLLQSRKVNTSYEKKSALIEHHSVLQFFVNYTKNGFPVASSPISTADDKRLYFNTLSDLAYNNNGQGFWLTYDPNLFIMVFDLTSTQQSSHDFIHPELTDCSMSVGLKFSVALPNNIEIFIIGEKAITVFVDSARRVSKYHVLTN